MAEQRITWSLGDDGVAQVRLARADKLNAIDAAMFDALIDAGERLAREPRLRAVVLAGEGRTFCAGLDMASFERMREPGGAQIAGSGQSADLAERTHGIANAAQQVAMVWREVPVPVIAAVHGVAFGGGLQVALGADLRLVAPDAQLSVMEIRWGLVPDMAGTVLMRRLMRADAMRELVYTGRIVSGAEAVTLGLATRACTEPVAEATELARGIARASPDAVRAAKRLMNAADSAGDADLLLAESIEQQRLIGSPNQVEAVSANLARRAPRFADPAG